MTAYDLIGIGFGPSNLALAIALEEKRAGGRHLEARFIERQPAFGWHQDMLLEDTHMQISFLKDLVTLRNPTSRFTFVNYLHQKQRLQDFINLKTFFPSRHEFHDYLAWAAAQFADRCFYGEEVLEVLPEKSAGEVTLLRVRTRTACGTVHQHLARNLVIGIGGTAHIPECFRSLHGDARIMHSSTYRQSIERQPHAKRIAVIGGGQSAAEIFLNLHGRPQAPQVDLIMRHRTLRPPDDSPFVNEIFNTDFVDYVFGSSQEDRNHLLAEFAHTNYACPDLERVQAIFNLFYQQKVTGNQRHRLLRGHAIQHVQATPSGMRLLLTDLDTGTAKHLEYDAIVLATGYERQQHKTLLEPLAGYLHDFAVDRHYRLETSKDFRPAIFLQGACEMTHGLSDTLLSVTAARTGEIGAVLMREHEAHAAAAPLRAVQA